MHVSIDSPTWVVVLLTPTLLVDVVHNVLHLTARLGVLRVVFEGVLKAGLLRVHTVRVGVLSEYLLKT